MGGQKNLGAGAFGIVGLWKYGGTEEKAPEVKQVVVKMVLENQDWNSQPPITRWGPEQTGLTEALARSLKVLANLTHVIRQYGGPKVGDRFNEGMGRVVKQFLEFCPGGNVEELTGKFQDEDKSPMPRKAIYSEPDIWTMFYCLALGIVGMSLRTESPTDSEWQVVDQVEELCHFDIKPDNRKHLLHCTAMQFYSTLISINLVLFGFRDANHRRLPILNVMFQVPS
jgi:serine/threonine protein kinase